MIGNFKWFKKGKKKLHKTNKAHHDDNKGWQTLSIRPGALSTGCWLDQVL